MAQIVTLSPARLQRVLKPYPWLKAEADAVAAQKAEHAAALRAEVARALVFTAPAPPHELCVRADRVADMDSCRRPVRVVAAFGPAGTRKSSLLRSFVPGVGDGGPAAVFTPALPLTVHPTTSALQAELGEVGGTPLLLLDAGYPAGESAAWLAAHGPLPSHVEHERRKPVQSEGPDGPEANAELERLQQACAADAKALRSARTVHGAVVRAATYAAADVVVVTTNYGPGNLEATDTALDVALHARRTAAGLPALVVVWLAGQDESAAFRAVRYDARAAAASRHAYLGASQQLFRYYRSVQWTCLPQLGSGADDAETVAAALAELHALVAAAAAAVEPTSVADALSPLVATVGAVRAVLGGAVTPAAVGEVARRLPASVAASVAMHAVDGRAPPAAPVAAALLAASACVAATPVVMPGGELRLAHCRKACGGHGAEHEADVAAATPLIIAAATAKAVKPHALPVMHVAEVRQAVGWPAPTGGVDGLTVLGVARGVRREVLRVAKESVAASLVIHLHVELVGAPVAVQQDAAWDAPPVTAAEVVKRLDVLLSQPQRWATT
jgi:hypothetical protein